MTEILIAPDRTKMLVTLEVEGVRVQQDRLDPGSARARKRLLGLLGVPVSDADLIGWFEAARIASGPVRFPVSSGKPVTTEHYVIRPLDRPRAAGETVTLPASRFVTERLAGVPLTHVVEWDGAENLCCLDVDYHDSAPPPRDWLASIVYSRLAPKPYAWHFSRGGGLHLFYVACSPFSAEELASVAALRLRAVDAAAGLELKTVLRGPSSEPVVVLPKPDTGGAVLGDWFGAEGTDEDARDEWLASEDMALDSRYPHSKCPIAPSPDEGEKRSPVLVSEAGVYCFVCEGKGRTMGCRRPGFAPWNAILGAPTSGDLGKMVSGMAHWGHAKWVLTERYGMPEKLAKLAYKAALKARHAGTQREPLIEAVFSRDTDDIARSGDQWYSVSKSYAYPRDIQQIVSRFPAACVVSDGETRVNPAALCDLLQAKDLSDRGYPSIERIHGFKLAGVHTPANRTQVAVPNPDLSARHRPRYILRTERMGEEEAWHEIEKIVPLIDRTLVKASLCAFGTAQETQSGMPPFMFVAGPSAAGKSSTIRIAAAILGGRIGAEAVYDRDTTRFRQAIYEGSSAGPVVVINELLKDAGKGRDKLTAREALDPLLNLTKDSASWVAYRGPVRFGRIPAVVVTEIECPAYIRDETQIARRIRHHRVFGRKDEWKRTLALARLSDMHMLRAVSDRVSAACNAILSSVCDDYFAVPMTWDEQADSLGVRTIEEDPSFDDPSDRLLEFFRLVCAATDLVGRDATRYGSGYKRISRADASSPDDEDDLVSVYGMFADGPGADWVNARRLAERDWSAVLKTDEPVWYDHRTDGTNVFVRFRTGLNHKAPAAVNGDIRTRSP